MNARKPPMPLKVTLLGLGNLLMQDEGVGVQAVRLLEERYELPPHLEVVDGGTSGLDLLPYIEGRDRVLVVDGVEVARDTQAGLVGSTGNSSGPHLHFEAWQAGTNVTPAFLPGSTMPLSKTRLAAARARVSFRKEILEDGSVLFTNIPASVP